MASLRLICKKCGRLSEPIYFDIKEVFWGGKPSKKRYMQKVVECAEANGWAIVKGEPYCSECTR